MGKYRTDNEWEALNAEHRNGATIPELSNKYAIHVQSMYTAFKRLNLKVIKRAPNKGSSYNHNFFSSITTELQAYVLGWIYSDGYISTRNRVGIKVQVSDKYIIDLIQTNIAPTLKLTYELNTVGIQLSSKILYTDLEKIGVLRRKSYQEFSMPDLPLHLMNPFIIGYFDGDGTISISKQGKCNWNICSVNKLFLDDMLIYLTSLNIKCKIYKESRVHFGYQDIYRLAFIGYKTDKIHTFNTLYKNITYKLPRKFEKLHNLYGNTEEK